MKRMDRPTLKRLDRIVDEAGFVQRVGMDAHLSIRVVCDGERGTKYRWDSSPVFVTFHANRAGLYLFNQGCFAVSVALAENANIDRPVFERA
jgi:hypothetical protein